MHGLYRDLERHSIRVHGRGRSRRQGGRVFPRRRRGRWKSYAGRAELLQELRRQAY